MSAKFFALACFFMKTTAEHLQTCHVNKGGRNCSFPDTKSACCDIFTGDLKCDSGGPNGMSLAAQMSCQWKNLQTVCPIIAVRDGSQYCTTTTTSTTSTATVASCPLGSNIGKYGCGGPFGACQWRGRALCAANNECHCKPGYCATWYHQCLWNSKVASSLSSASTTTSTTTTAPGTCAFAMADGVPCSVPGTNEKCCDIMMVLQNCIRHSPDELAQQQCLAKASGEACPIMTEHFAGYCLEPTVEGITLSSEPETKSPIVEANSGWKANVGTVASISIACIAFAAVSVQFLRYGRYRALASNPELRVAIVASEINDA